jgi:hypothetical protein
MTASFKPIYLPYNDMARTVVSELAAELGLTLKGKAGEKNTAILASFLAYAQIVGVGGDLNWAGGTTSQDTNGFAFYPAAGASTIKAVRQALLDAGYLTYYDDLPSGLRDCSNAELAKIMGMQQHGLRQDIGKFRINAMPLFADTRLSTASFIDALRPYVLVNKAEEYLDKIKRDKDQLKTPRLSWKAVYRGAFSTDAFKAKHTVTVMNAFWAKHPLTRPSSNTRPAQYFASATRVFHNGSMTSGGRWYGAWTQMRSEQRLKLQIDGEAVCEIDLNASQPTLLSSLLGIRMDVGRSWTDVYAAVVGRLKADEEPKLLRNMVKQVLVEMIGAGNSSREQPATYAQIHPDNIVPKFDTLSLFFDSDHSRDLYHHIQETALDVFPALSQLNTEYLNGTGFLSYHEAEILTQTLLKLKDLGVVAYGVHDCIIVKQSDKDIAVKTYRRVIHDYVLAYQKRYKLPQLQLEVCVTIEQIGSDDVTLPGRYLS